MAETPKCNDGKYLQKAKEINLNVQNKKGFIYYCRVSVNDGLNTNLCNSDLLLDKFDEKVF